MPFKSIEDRRRYAREWCAKRRAAWLAEHGPCVACGSTENLEVDHADRSTKIAHCVWSWSTPRRDAELAKCQVLCADCHATKTTIERLGRMPSELSLWRRRTRAPMVKAVNYWTAYLANVLATTNRELDGDGAFREPVY